MAAKLVRDCMIRNIATIPPSASLMEVMRKMVRQAPGFAVVLENMAIQGLVTEYDLIRWMVQGLDLERTTVSSMRLSHPTVVRENTPCQELLRIYHQRRYRRFPVLNEDEVLSGGILEKQILLSLPRSNLMEHYRVADVMVSRLPLLPPGSTYLEVAKRVVEWHRGCVLIGQGTRLAGLVSEGDLLRCRVRPDWTPELPVDGFMTTAPKSIGPERNLLFAFDFFRSTGHRRLPVMDEAGNLLGVITQTDLLRQMVHAVRSHQAVLNPEDITEPAIWFSPEEGLKILACNEKGAQAMELEGEGWVGRSVEELAAEPELWRAVVTLLRNCTSLGPVRLVLASGRGRQVNVDSSFTLINTPTGDDRVFWTIKGVERVGECNT